MPELLAGRYEVLRPLGTGGMGDVLLVRDTRDGHERALKRLHVADPEALGRLRDEFAALARIEHPNIVRVFDYGTLGDGAPYFTMEYLEGKPLNEAVAPGDVSGVLRALRDTLAGLAALHAAGLVHCDLKASNLIVVAAADGRSTTRILDLGLAGRLSDASGERVRGTPGHVAPEVLDGAPYSRESDYYALGATLYRVLSGRPAFPGRDAAAILSAQRNRRPSVLPLRTAGVPRALEVAVLGLLDSDKASRHRAIESLLRLVHDHLPLAEDAPSARTPQGRGSFVGRDEERKRLLHHLLRNGAHAAVIAGPLGSGRTRLAREIAIEAELAGWAVHWLDVDAEFPAGATAAAGARGTLLVLDDADLWTPETLAALPLGQLSAPFAIVATVHGANLRSAWRGAFLRLPADPAWLDLELEPLSDPDVSALFHSRGAAADQGELIEVTVSSVGRIPGALHDAIDALSAHDGALRTSAGWRLESRLARQSLESQQPPSDPDRWNDLSPEMRAVALALSGWPVVPSLEEIGAWTSLPAEAVEAALRELEWAGWAERAETGWRVIPRGRADWVLDFAAGNPVRERIVAALRLQLEESGSAGTSENFAWASVLGRHELALGNRESAFRRLRSAIELAGVQPGARVRQAANALQRAVPAQGLEGAQTFSELASLWERLDAPKSAIECYALAVDALSPSEWRLAATWTLERASILIDLGRFDESLRVLEEFSSSAFTAPTESDGEVVRIRAGIASMEGFSLQMKGLKAAARTAYERALKMLPADAFGARAVTQNRLGTMMYLSGSQEEGTRLIQEATKNAEASGDTDILARVLFNVALCARHEDRFDEENRALSETIALGRTLPRRDRYIKALAARATVLSNHAHWTEFDKLAAELESLARESQNTHLLLQVMASRATASMRRGLVQQQRGIERVERAWLGSITHSEARLHHLAHRAQRLLQEGNEVAAASLARTVLRRARADLLPNYERQSLLILGSIALQSGDLPRAKRMYGKVARETHIDPSLIYGAFVGLARIARRERDHAKIAELTSFVTSHPKRALWWDPLREELEAIRCLLEGRPADSVSHFQTALEHYARHELRPIEMESAWEAGLALADAGERTQANRSLRRAHGIARALGLQVQTGRLADLILDDPDSIGPVDQKIGASEQEPDTLVRVAGVLNSLLDFPTLLAQALDLVCTRVGAERGFILLTDGESDGLRAVAQHGVVDDTSREKALEVSRTVVRQVTESGHAFRSDDASNDPRLGSTLSILDMSVRALLCTPLRLKDKVIGTIYVENRDAVTHFSDRDAAVIDAFGNLVAVTIQNSRLHEELRRSRDRVIGQNLSLRREVSSRYSRPNIVGQSSEIERVLGEIERVALSRGSVLITGESGTGKELVAKTIHFASPRVDRPFLSLNCAALPADLIESELFGIEDHVATGVRGRPGIFERADGGTLFLDEIGDMPLSLQAKLLRVLQEREFSRLGGSRVVRVDIRLIAATNQDLRQLIRDGRFREDLYFRVHTLPIHIAPLRERKVDIPILANHFLHRFCEENGLPVPRISAEFTGTILTHAWPGNVRELQNYIERSVVMSRGPILEPVVLPTEEDPGGALSGERSLPSHEDDSPRHGNLKEALEEAERRWILKTLERFEGNQRQAARALGVVEPTLRYRMGRLGIAASAKSGRSASRPKST